MAQGKFIFISGGVRSGKSSFAERVAIDAASRVSTRKLHYVACGQPADAEMVKRIRHHQEDRENSPLPWQTRECPTKLERVAGGLTGEDVVLVDCLTTLLGNEMFAYFKEEAYAKKTIQNKLKESILYGINEIIDRAAVVILVSNEVMHEGVNAHLFTATYTKLLGQLHQALVGMADSAYLVEMGIPIVMKGEKNNE